MGDSVRNMNYMLWEIVLFVHVLHIICIYKQVYIQTYIQTKQTRFGGLVDVVHSPATHTETMAKEIAKPLNLAHIFHRRRPGRFMVGKMNDRPDERAPQNRLDRLDLNIHICINIYKPNSGPKWPIGQRLVGANTFWCEINLLLNGFCRGFVT